MNYLHISYDSTRSKVKNIKFDLSKIENWNLMIKKKKDCMKLEQLNGMNFNQ